MQIHFPHGHPKFLDLAIQEIATHSQKNYGYAHGGAALGNFNRCARFMEMYPMFPYDKPWGFAFLLALKHIDALAWGMAGGHRSGTAMSENCTDTSVYMKIIECAFSDAGV